MTSRLARLETFVGDHPILLAAGALSISGSIELLQGIPEVVAFGHEIGELARNMGYGVAAAFAFNWIMVVVPREREQRRILDAYWWSFSYMAISGALLLAQYRERAPAGAYDTQTEEGMKRFLDSVPLIEDSMPLSSPQPRVSSGGVDYIRSDPFADSLVLRDLDTHGRLLNPFLDRLNPEVADAIAEMIHLQDRIDLGPIHMPPGSLVREFPRIWELVRLSRRVRHVLKKHYPDREIIVPRVASVTPSKDAQQIVESDL